MGCECADIVTCPCHGHCGHAPKCIGVGETDERDPLGCCNCGTREAEKHAATQQKAMDRAQAHNRPEGAKE